MPRIRPFEDHADRYEDWFERHDADYRSELQAVARFVPREGTGVEIGAGTGRFASPLGIRFGVEPAERMARIAADRGIRIVRGAGEELPVRSGAFDFAVLVTTLCFLDDPNRAFSEIRRILKPGGCVVVGFVDGESPLGIRYRQASRTSRFYAEADFYAVPAVLEFLAAAGFRDAETVQTLFAPAGENRQVEPVRTGWGEGSFVVIRAVK
ncbi:methyltransferase domain-containing protein [bacterium]|nr:methyltransferase domain-containing protein [bacterium]